MKSFFRNDEFNLNLDVYCADCPISKIVCILIDTPTRKMLVTDLSELTLRLNTDAVLVENLRKDKLLDKRTYIDTIPPILEEWRSKNSLEAKLKTLINIMRKCKWNDMAGTFLKYG